jgi:hypothetical protein
MAVNFSTAEKQYNNMKIDEYINNSIYTIDVKENNKKCISSQHSLRNISYENKIIESECLKLLTILKSFKENIHNYSSDDNIMKVEPNQYIGVKIENKNIKYINFDNIISYSNYFLLTCEKINELIKKFKNKYTIKDINEQNIMMLIRYGGMYMYKHIIGLTLNSVIYNIELNSSRKNFINFTRDNDIIIKILVELKSADNNDEISIKFDGNTDIIKLNRKYNYYMDFISQLKKSLLFL